MQLNPNHNCIIAKSLSHKIKNAQGPQGDREKIRKNSVENFTRDTSIGRARKSKVIPASSAQAGGG
jgi:hypothetical protein